MNGQPPTDELRVHPEDPEAPKRGTTVIVISSDAIGRGDDGLGQVLLRNHLHALTEITPGPDVLVFFNAGVFLAVEGSLALDDLRALAGQGVKMLLCGTCLGHYGLRDKVAVGEISNMYEISETMLRA